MSQRKDLSISISVDLHTKLKIKAALQQTSMQALVAPLLIEMLKDVVIPPGLAAQVQDSASDNEPVHLLDLRGIASDATGGKSSEDFVRELRQESHRAKE